jgi:hypothetical protein
MRSKGVTTSRLTAGRVKSHVDLSLITSAGHFDISKKHLTEMDLICPLALENTTTQIAPF